jgi:hypothetical protein
MQGVLSHAIAELPAIPTDTAFLVQMLVVAILGNAPPGGVVAIRLVTLVEAMCMATLIAGANEAMRLAVHVCPY